MNDSPTHSGKLAEQVERIVQRKHEATAKLQKLWNDGELPRENLPCHDKCNGEVRVSVDGVQLTGFCPAFEQKGVCPLVSRAERELTERLVRAGFGKRYHSPDPTRIRGLETVNEWLANMATNVRTGRGLVFSGDVGVGKTMALAYIGRQLLEADIGVWCVHMEQVVSALADRDRRGAALRRLKSVQVLMLDDLGAAEFPTWMLGVFEGAMEYRYANMKPTFITTNLTRKDLVDASALRRVIDRLRETNTFVNIGGNSQRHA